MAARWSMVVVFALCGCDRVLGLEERRPDAATVPIDALVSTVVSLDVPASLAIGEVATVTAMVAGVPGSSVICTFSADRGSFPGNEVPVDLDGGGAGMANVAYTAPATSGPVMIRAAIGTSSVSKSLSVRGMVTAGHDSNLGGGVAVYPAGTLVGTRIALPTELFVTQIGVWASGVVAGTQARLGIYDTNLNLVTATGIAFVVTGRNVYPLASTLAPGTYWIVSIFDGQEQLFAQSTVANEGYNSTAQSSISAPMPVVLPTGVQRALRHSHFLLGTN